MSRCMGNLEIGVYHREIGVFGLDCIIPYLSREMRAIVQAIDQFVQNCRD